MSLEEARISSQELDHHTAGRIPMLLLWKTHRVERRTWKRSVHVGELATECALTDESKAWP